MQKLQMFENKIDNKAIFLIRHFNDLDFLLPIILLFKKPQLIFINRVKLYECHKKIIVNNNILIHQNSNLSFILVFILNLTQRVLKLIKINFNYLKKIESYFILKKIKSLILYNKNNLIKNFVFDHTVDFNSIILIKFIKNHYHKPNIISVPHGVDFFSNRMNDIYHIENKKIDYSLYSKVICNDLNHYDRILSDNKEIISNLRYTHEWVNYIKNNYYNNKKKIKKLTFLIIHSKKIGNIHFEEVIRCMKILSNFKNFRIIVKPHTRISRNNSEINTIKKINNKIEISYDYMIDISNQADFIITFQSSALLDGLLLNKLIIFPKYATSNTLDKKILKHMKVIENPDSFLTLLKDIEKKHIEVNGASKYQTDDYKNLSNNWKKVFV